MTNKIIYIIVFLAIQLTCTSNIAAQQSANATMRVTVRVVNTVDIESAESIVNKDAGSTSFDGQFIFGGVEDRRTVVQTQKEVQLKNNLNHQLTLPLISSQEQIDGQLKFNFTSGHSESLSRAQGHYSGTITTTVEHL